MSLGILHLGWDKHTFDVNPRTWPNSGYVAFIYQWGYLYGLSFTKLSVLLFYRRLTSGSISRWYKTVIYVAIGIVVGYTIAYTIGYLVVCKPIEYYWQLYSLTWLVEHPGASCMSGDARSKATIAAGVLSVFTDLYTVLLPMIVLRTLRINPRAKLA